jgi:hypothetical protein
LLVLAGVLWSGACRGVGRPDVLPFEPILEEDSHLVTLLNEAMDVGERDTDGAVRSLREQVVPRARRNAESAGATAVRHPRAVELRTRLCQRTAERAETSGALADALAGRDADALSRALRKMRQLALDMERLEQDVQRARQEPATGGCASAGVGR